LDLPLPSLFVKVDAPKRANTKKTNYDRSVDHLLQLLKGGFRKGQSFDVEWLNANNIPKEIAPYTLEELKGGLRSLLLMYQDGYWPPDKDRLPKYLSQLIYNKKFGNSYLLKVLIRPPTIKDFYKEKVDNYPEISEIVSEILPLDSLNKKNRNLLLTNLELLVEFNSHLPSDKGRPDDRLIQFYFPKSQPVKFVKEYVRFLKTQEWIKEFSVGLFRPDSGVFAQFMDYEEDSMQIRIRR
jgi:hypothetical protein